MPKNEVEALLFSAGKNMTVDAIANLVGTDKREVVKDLQELQQEYNARDSALMIVDEGDLWKIHVREKYLPLVQKIVADTELPKTVLETLAVIAYKSPVLQSDVINIRTSTAYEHIGLLIDMGFVTREKSGRSFLLRVTDKFFDYFDIAGDKTMQEIFKNVKKRAPPKVEKDEGANGEGSEGQATLMDIPKVEIVDETADEVQEVPLPKKRDGPAKVLDMESDGTADPDRHRHGEMVLEEKIAMPKEKAEVAQKKEREEKVPQQERPPEKKQLPIPPEILEDEKHDVTDVLEKVEEDIEKITTKRKRFQDQVKKKINT